VGQPRGHRCARCGARHGAALGLGVRGHSLGREDVSPGALSLGRLLVGALVLLAIAASAGSLGATTYLVPPLSVLLGGSLLSETPPGLALLGGVLCLAGVAVVRRG
jgi:drug/metabolite transporter (DMT)-like permease